MTSEAGSGSPEPRSRPGLHAIAVFEAAKGLLALLAAIALEWAGPAPLRDALHGLASHFQTGGGPVPFATALPALDAGSVHLAAATGLLYALMRFIEAWGLWRLRRWASWLGCIGAAVYLPLDLYALHRHPGVLAAIVLAVNLLVVWVLARDLRTRSDHVSAPSV